MSYTNQLSLVLAIKVQVFFSFETHTISWEHINYTWNKFPTRIRPAPLFTWEDVNCSFVYTRGWQPIDISILRSIQSLNSIYLYLLSSASTSSRSLCCLTLLSTRFASILYILADPRTSPLCLPNVSCWKAFKCVLGKEWALNEHQQLSDSDPHLRYVSRHCAALDNRLANIGVTAGISRARNTLGDKKLSTKDSLLSIFCRAHCQVLRNTRQNKNWEKSEKTPNNFF